MIKRGEVYWTQMDPSVGAEVRKTRPAVIVSNDIGNANANIVTVLPLTTSVKRVYPYDVLLKAGTCGNTPDCKVMGNQIRTIDKSRLGALMGALPEFLMTQVDRAMRRHLAL